MSDPLCLAALVLAVDGLVGSGYFLFALGLLCAGLGLYFRKQSPAEGASDRPAPKQAKGKKGRKSKKNKKQSDPGPRQDQPEGGSLIWGGLGFALIGIGMVLFGFFR